MSSKIVLSQVSIVQTLNDACHFVIQATDGIQFRLTNLTRRKKFKFAVLKGFSHVYGVTIPTRDVYGSGGTSLGLAQDRPGTK